MKRDDQGVARRRMVEEQLKARGIHDAHVLRLMAALPRHLFVDEALEARAYSDHALPIGEEQTISQPFMVALMTQALDLTGDEKVLEIGTGSGYQTAILAELADRVFTIERIPSIAEAAKERLTALGYHNIVFRRADGSLGWKEMAPFDRILVTAGAPRVPAFVGDQLRVGGIAVLPVGSDQEQALVKLVKTETGIEKKVLTGCTFVPLIGRGGWKAKEASP
ncbi:MAG TPA: protein-L-isoaspartate(D-aspartate) O-methyltransferase [Candidatus Eisenbacteria bacterium]|jgi:protein-L-isoaspartate(D-aspartate) O-methyltransferase|nr:protein-L-isoaspartate(D-aspartate) O-methyltransferase [Candidatus Eisenbacteria bacterium]